MARNEFYTQCRLITVALPARQLNTWIPSELAKKGLVIRLKEWPRSEWTEPYTVLETYATRSGGEVEAREDDYKHQRETSDV